MDILISEVEDRCVKFSWKDYRANGKRKTIHLSPLELIRRFSAYILPPRFVRIRQHGLLTFGSSTNKCMACNKGTLVLVGVVYPSARGDPTKAIEHIIQKRQAV